MMNFLNEINHIKHDSQSMKANSRWFRFIFLTFNVIFLKDVYWHLIKTTQTEIWLFCQHPESLPRSQKHDLNEV